VNFDFSADQESLRHTARGFLEAHASLRVCRAVLESDQPYSRELWKRVAALGWLGASIPEEHGGAGMGYLELAVLAEEMGRALAPIPFSSSVYLATEALLLSGSPEQKRKYLPRLAAGEAIGALALVEGVGQRGVANVATRFADGVLTGTKLPVLDGAAADFAIVSARDQGGVSLVLVDLHLAQIRAEGHPQLDVRPVALDTLEAQPSRELEIGHAAARDNLRRLVLAASPDVLAWLPAGARLRRDFEQAAEAAADRRALERVRPETLARALLKAAALVREGQRLELPVAAFDGAAPLADRVRALLDSEPEAVDGAPVRALALAAAALVVAGAAAFSAARPEAHAVLEAVVRALV